MFISFRIFALYQHNNLNHVDQMETHPVSKPLFLNQMVHGSCRAFEPKVLPHIVKHMEKKRGA